MGSRKQSLIEVCVCGSRSLRDRPPKNGLTLIECSRCGALIQRLDTTEKKLSAWYRDEYPGVYTHTVEQDYRVAGERLKAYGPKLEGRILDIGCGAGAFFVDACRDKGLDAEGQEIGPVNEAKVGYIHGGSLFDLNFPTDRYDVITCHDVLEHTVDPVRFLRELRRMLKPGGWFILDWPDFAFEHHWKPIEHIWLLTLAQVRRLLELAGFDPIYTTRPVESKAVFYSTKVAEKRPTILLPPGIGDSYWSVVKLPGFMREELGVEAVDLYVSDPDDRQRSLEWIRKIPWASAAGYVRHAVTSSEFREAYMTDGRYLFEKVVGCDYFMAFNGVMRFGADIDKVEPAWGSEWLPKMFRSKVEQRAESLFRDRFGPYVVAYFIDAGMYKRWLDELPVGKIAETLRRIKETGFEVVFMGAGWDAGGLPSILAGAVGGVDLCGETSIDEMFGLLRGSHGVIGWPAGNTIMATVLGKETLLFWNRYFDQRFWAFSCPPASRNVWYFWADTAKGPAVVDEQVAAWLGRMAKP